MNYDIHRKRPILSESQEKVFPDVISTPYTNDVSKIIGKWMRSVPLIGDRLEDYSNPLHIQNVLNDWFASLGSIAITSLDKILTELGVAEEMMEPLSDNWVDNLEKNPVLRGFIARGNNSQSLKDFWKNYSSVKKQLDSVAYLRKEKRFEEANKYLVERYGPKEGYRAIALQFLQDGAETMSILSHDIKRMTHLTVKDATAQGITPNKAYDMIEQRYRSMVENAQQYNKAVEVINKRFTNE